ncbi:methylase involved in ubiquinone/menaquinone biosynthesis [Schinkia azotoformans MEV2011]|uniref:Methylase involved in ubiquinone/menaquinone biosynthesis n=1 Tax=Schinkia azotoformans MEV2011 TaxID=1348973 RepID=A0A072NZN3_SCHAZ|nr:class I SAM-dependent methyltransferase [Schinkia azotoformans]KEF38695.1 methylase involved in ubiquinone/menaquinone biosynthesis [Schinkia azotoformans MEV2011]MEC1696880.1 methyltransferase domain-containing protein [Schinkia azotoformans]MEC1717851.1 methyltransferase domain-containing protein [Schinkia azotoformans]MEC1727219.1 methyltransferase domain-containing protein [Schinkia azotoformans]MEC1739700.1 methyltransferase domain-containing protein [Schinkia azotoformans]
MPYNHSIKDNWDASLYDGKHSFVSIFGSELIDLLAPHKGENILDLGCGTGDLAKKLFDLEVNVIAVDKSENMIRNAKSKYPNIYFEVNDAIKLEYNCKFDAVFSNATLHWVKPPKQALQHIFSGLKHGGRFVAEFGGKGNVQKITSEIINQRKKLGYEFKMENFPWYYPSIGEYTSLMEEVGFRVTFAQHFDRPTPLDGDNGLRNWIEMFGGDLFEGISENTKNQIIANVEHNLKGALYNQKNNSWIADYKRIRVVGIKNK